MNSFIFLDTFINSFFTALIVVALVLIAFIEKKFIDKKQESLHKIHLIVLYLLLFIIVIFSFGLILYIWNYDINNFLQETWTSIIAELTIRIGALIGSIIIFFVAIFFIKISKITLSKIGKNETPNRRRKRTIAKISMSVIKYIVAIVAILLILSFWGVNVLPALAGLGMIGLVIGLGAQKFINDLISGFFIVFEHHFDVGDKIEVKGFKGEVIDIGLKTTKIKGWRGDVKILSNGDINDITNYSMDTSTAVVEFGIAYREDVQKTIDLLMIELPKIRDKYPQIIEDPQVLGVISLASSSVNLRVIAKTLNEQHYAVERGLLQMIKEILDENNIEIPFPQVVVNQPKEPLFNGSDMKTEIHKKD
jgi:small conductance mechanosensitive channel